MARPASDIRDRLVRAARDCFLVDGVEGASLRAIARKAGTNLGMVYYYHPTKDDLFLAVVEDVYGKLLADLESLLTGAAHDTRQVVETLAARAASLSEDEAKVVRLILREAMGTDSARLVRLFERFSRGHIALLSRAFQGGIEHGQVRADLPPLVLVVSSFMVTLLPQLIRRRLSETPIPVDALLPEPAALGRALASVLLEGIEAKRAPDAERATVSASEPKAGADRER